MQGLFHIAIHRKFQTRRVAEDSTQLYGEATLMPGFFARGK